MKRKGCAFIVTVAIAINMMGCVKTPEGEFVRQKGDTDYTLNSQTEEMESYNDEQKVKERIAAREHEEFDICYEVDDINIQVNAQVHVPDVSTIPIVRMKRNDFGIDSLEPYTKLFFGENEIVYENGTKNSFDSQNLYKVTGMAENGQEGMMRILNYEENSSVAYMTYSYLESGVNPIPKDELQGVENVCRYSEEEAIKLGQSYISKMDNTQDYHLQKILYHYNELENTIEGYQFFYKRVYAGVNETYDLTNLDFDEKNAHSPYGYDYIVMGIRDEGLVFFDWENPMTPDEVISSNADLLPYDEIMDIFKQQVRYSTAMGDYNMDQGGDIGVVHLDEEKGINTTITSIVLGYMRVREKDTQQYILVPVWDFQGKFHNGQSILTINAMDGTIINRKVGY